MATPFTRRTAHPRYGFNRSPGHWGALENDVLSQAKGKPKDGGQRYCLFAGPVLGKRDRVFTGVDDRGPIRVQVPQRFWKVVVATGEGGLQAYAFVLEQSLKTVKTEAEEFRVDEEWQHALVSIRELEDILGLVTFPKAVRDAARRLPPTGRSWPGQPEFAMGRASRMGDGTASSRP